MVPWALGTAGAKSVSKSSTRSVVVRYQVLGAEAEILRVVERQLEGLLLELDSDRPR